MTNKHDNRKDKQGWTTKVTHLGNGWYGCRVINPAGEVHSESMVKGKAAIKDAMRELLRWVDKMGFDSDLASAARMR